MAVSKSSQSPLLWFLLPLVVVVCTSMDVTSSHAIQSKTQERGLDIHAQSPSSVLNLINDGAGA